MSRLPYLLTIFALLVSSIFLFPPAIVALDALGTTSGDGVDTPGNAAGASRAEPIDMPGFLAPVDPPRGHYTIDCRFDIEDGTITGTGTIRLKNTSSLTLRRLAIRWPFDEKDRIELTIGGNPCSIVSDSAQLVDDRVILVELAEPLKPRRKIVLVTSFVKDLSSWLRDGRYRVTAWYPRVVWGFPTCDDFAVMVEVPDEYQLAATGRRNPKTGRYEAMGAREFALFCGSGLQTMEEQVGDVLVRCLYTAKGAACARRVMETAVDAIGFYQERFGFYPSRALSIIPGSESSVGGYPVGTDVVAMHSMESMEELPDIHWRWITAHEIAHQYWLEYVLPADNWVWGWLTIGLGIYMDREYIRDRGLPEDKHKGLIKRYVEGVHKGCDTRADVYFDYLRDIGFDFNNVVVHGKGYSIISALTCLLGESTLNSIHNRCLKEFARRRMGDYDFQSVCEEESGRDLDWFFNQWVRSKRYPSYEITSQDCTESNGRYHSTITIDRTGSLRMPVPVMVTFESGQAQLAFTDRLCDVNILHFVSATPLQQAVIDPAGEIALIVPLPSEELIAVLGKIENLPHSSSVMEIPSLVTDAQRLGIKDLQLWGKLGLALYDWKYYDHALELYRASAVQLEQTGSYLTSLAFSWMGIILDLMGRREEAIEAYQRALEKDTGDAFSFPEFGIKINRTWLENRLENPFVRE